MTDSPRDETDRLLGSMSAHSLSVYDVAPERAEEIRRHVHVLLRQRAQPEPRPAWLLSYHRFVEPAVLLGLGLWQLAWTVQDTLALFH